MRSRFGVAGRRLLAGLVLLVLTTPVAGAAAQGSLRAQQWGLDTIRAPEVWPATRGAGTVVAVVDTGVDLRHPDLAPQLLRDREGRVVGRDFVDGGAPQDDNGHGTQVAGVIAAAARSADGLAGVAPRTAIMPVRALDEDGVGSSSDIDAAIRWAVDNGADVINLSLESAVPVPGEVVATGFDRAVRYAWERGVVVVAASGNTGTPFTDYRASTPVLLVGATDRDDRRATFSDGSRADMVVAPGVDIVTTACSPCGDDSRPGHATASGTSFAAPHVAGALALLRAGGRGPQPAVEALRDTAVEVSGSGLGSSGHGRIDVAAAFGVADASDDGQATGADPPDRRGDGDDRRGDAAPGSDAGGDPRSARGGGSSGSGDAAGSAGGAATPADGPSTWDRSDADRDRPEDLANAGQDQASDPASAGADERDDGQPPPEASEVAPLEPLQDEVAVDGGSGMGFGLRFGLLEVFASVLLGGSGFAVAAVARRHGLDDAER